jgi:hypothetical protein
MTDSKEPVHLIEDAETGDRFLIYGTEKGTRVELRYDGDNLWMTQAQMAELFGVDRSVVTKHLANIYESGELDTEATSAKVAQVRTEGGREVTRQIETYNLDAVISVGYRVSTRQGTQFRKWATEKLVQFATTGFVIDAQRLKNPDSFDRIKELREIIRDIRSDEANVYLELRNICKLFSDYDPNSSACHDFFMRMQAKVMYGVTSHTPSELIISRANADHENMGLRTWARDDVRKSDVTVSKNYLVETEIQELNRLTTILLDVFEDQLKIGKLMSMGQAEALLDDQLKGLNRNVLRHGGVVKSDSAKAHAHTEYQRFDAKRKAIRHAQAEQALLSLKKQDKSLPKRQPKKAGH